MGAGPRRVTAERREEWKDSLLRKSRIAHGLVSGGLQKREGGLAKSNGLLKQFTAKSELFFAFVNCAVSDHRRKPLRTILRQVP